MALAEPTKGPWRFRSTGGGVALFAEHSGMLVVLDAGEGRIGATRTPVLRLRDERKLMVPVADLGIRPQAHNPWLVVGVDHPDARLIESAPLLYEAGKAFLDAVDRSERCGAEGIDADEWEAARAAFREVIAKAEGREPLGRVPS